MNRLTSNMIKSFIFGCALIMLFSIAPAAFAQGCVPGTGTLSGNFTGPNTTVVNIYLTTSEQEALRVVHSGTVTSITPQLNGTLVVTTSDSDTWYNNEDHLLGTSQSTETIILTPTTTPGVFTFQATITLIAGTGTDKRKDTCGTIQALGVADFINGTLTSNNVNSTTCHACK